MAQGGNGETLSYHRSYNPPLSPQPQHFLQSSLPRWRMELSHVLILAGGGLSSSFMLAACLFSTRKVNVNKEFRVSPAFLLSCLVPSCMSYCCSIIFDPICKQWTQSRCCPDSKKQYCFFVLHSWCHSRRQHPGLT